MESSTLPDNRIDCRYGQWLTEDHPETASCPPHLGTPYCGCQVISTRIGMSFLIGTVKNFGGSILNPEVPALADHISEVETRNVSPPATIRLCEAYIFLNLLRELGN